MQYAVNETGEKIATSYSGQKAQCPLCENGVIAHCGEIYVHHWKHQVNKSCDAWFENETMWHRQWKEKFPKECREVIIKGEAPLFEKHIADIKTKSGVVIEFQNSSISTTEIRVRENFYIDMIWVINAESFVDNLKFRSKVNSGLRNLDSGVLESVNSFKRVLTDDIRKDEQDYTNEKYALERIKNDHERKLAEKESLLKCLDEEDEMIDNLIHEHFDQFHIFSTPLRKVYKVLNPEVYLPLISLRRMAAEIKKNMLEFEGKIKLVHDLNNVDILGERYKEVNHSAISENTLQFAGAVKVNDLKTMFPEVIKFDSYEYFQAFKFKQKEFTFFLDPKPFLKQYTKSFEKYQLELNEIEMKIRPEEITLREKIIQQINLMITELTEEEKTLGLKLKNKIELVSGLVKSIKRKQEGLEAELDEYRLGLESDNKNNRFKVMKENKGKYYFSWKYERKSWMVSKCPIYLDIGEEYLFQKVGDNNVLKVLKTEFISNFINHK